MARVLVEDVDLGRNERVHTEVRQIFLQIAFDAAHHRRDRFVHVDDDVVAIGDHHAGLDVVERRFDALHARGFFGFGERVTNAIQRDGDRGFSARETIDRHREVALRVPTDDIDDLHLRVDVRLDERVDVGGDRAIGSAQRFGGQRPIDRSGGMLLTHLAELGAERRRFGAAFHQLVLQARQ